MLIGIDHLVIACRDPDAAAEALEESLELRAAGGGRHPALGTFNRLVWLGDTYLELIGVWDRSLAETSWIGAPTVRALDHGGGLATFALASDDLDGDLARLRAAGSQLDGPLEGERTRPDGRAVRWRLAAPHRLDPDEPPFLIEHDTSAAEWTVDERAARTAERHPVGGPVRLATLELGVADVARASMRHLRTVGLQYRPSLAGRGARDAAIGRQTVRLRPVHGVAGARALPTIELNVLGGSSSASGLHRDVELLGCRWVVRPA